MPGTTRLELYEMPIEDALSILLVAGDGPDEIQRAARWVIEAHAKEALTRLMPQPEEAPPDTALKIIEGGKQ